jgi:hypothetical protein
MGNCILFHTWGTWRKDSICESVRYCTDPGCSGTDLKSNHSWGQWTYSEINSCKLLRHCLRCGKINIINAEHSWSEWYYESSTSCQRIRKCVRCGKRDTDNKIIHEMSSWKYRNDRQCHIYKTCKRCGCVESGFAHDWAEWEYRSDTDCTKTRICNRCDAKETVPHKHMWERATFFERICKRCKVKRNYLNPLNWNIQQNKKEGEQEAQEEKDRIAIIADIKACIEAEELHRKLLEGKKELRKKETQEAKESLKKSCSESMRYLKENFFRECLIIDSNIWMNDAPEYNQFISIFRYLLRRLKVHYKFYGPQFEEIINIKTNTSLENPKNRGSRVAISRIDELSSENLLSIMPINVEFKHPDHVDPLLVRLLLMNAMKGESATLLSDDNELRVRAREKFKEYGINNYGVFNMSDIMAHFDIIDKAIKDGIANKVAEPSSKANVIFMAPEVTKAAQWYG